MRKLSSWDSSVNYRFTDESQAKNALMLGAGAADPGHRVTFRST
jgi:hypothetical protein